MNEIPIDIGLPEKMQFRDHTSHIEIIRTWFGWKVVAASVFAVVWNGFLVVWYGHALRSGNLLVILFPILHVAVGVGLTYFVIAGWLNRTRITTDYGSVSVRHYPVPWIGNMTIEAFDLRQLYAKESSSMFQRNHMTYEACLSG